MTGADEPPMPYRPDEINAYGDVTVVKPGWVEIPPTDARGLDPKYFRVVGWAGSRRFPKPIRVAVVHKAAWQARLAKRAAAAPKNPLTPEQKRERLLAKQLRMPLREWRGLDSDQQQLLTSLAGSFEFDARSVLDRANGLETRLFQYHSFFAATHAPRRARFFAGPTNSGKTHAAFDRLADAPTGVYLAPLRLMALEGQESLQRRGVRCSLLTGEERDPVPGATHLACTIEMLDPHREYDLAVLDEIQMLADADRGPAWARALFGVRAPELVLTGDPAAEPLVSAVCREANVTLETTRFDRMAPLRVAAAPRWGLRPDELEPGTAVIAFSRRRVLEIRNDLVRAGRTVAVFYGNLGPTVRREEARRFRAGEADIAVATDAIGMGLNLPIRTLLFSEGRKFDGYEVRPLRPAEVRQIAGRAGRYGLAEAGEVGGIGSEVHGHVARMLAVPPDPADFPRAVAGPTIEHVEAIAELVGTSQIQEVLRFFVESVRFASSALRMGHLKEILLNAGVVDAVAPTRPVGVKWTLACAPVPTNTKRQAEQACFRAILAGIERGEPITAGRACDLGRELPHLGLAELETRVAQLTIYIWIAFRFPDLLPRREAAEDEREQANARIGYLLTRKAAVPVESGRSRRSGGRRGRWGGP